VTSDAGAVDVVVVESVDACLAADVPDEIGAFLAGDTHAAHKNATRMNSERKRTIFRRRNGARWFPNTDDSIKPANRPGSKIGSATACVIHVDRATRSQAP
jgi:hypothetical protein